MGLHPPASTYNCEPAQASTYYAAQSGYLADAQACIMHHASKNNIHNKSKDEALESEFGELPEHVEHNTSQNCHAADCHQERQVHPCADEQDGTTKHIELE